MEQLNCTGGANTTLTRPTSIEECCNNGGISFDNGVGECINCAGMCIYSQYLILIIEVDCLF